MKKIFNIVMYIFFMVCMMTMNITASEGNVISADIKTDKQEYKTGDQIEIRISIKNISANTGGHTIISYTLPDGIENAESDGEINKNNIIWKMEKFEKNKEYTYSIKGKVSNALTSEDVGVVKKVTVDTADYTNQNVLYLLGGVSLIIISVVIVKHKKTGKILLVFGLAASTLTLNTVHAEELYNEYDSSHNIKVGSKTLKGKLRINVVFEENSTGDIPGMINLTNEVNEYNVIPTEDKNITLKGTAIDRNGIEHIEYTAVSATGEQQKAVANGKESWSFNFKPNAGTTDITVSCIDTLHNKTSLSFKVNKLTNAIELADEVMIAEDAVVKEIDSELVDIIHHADTKEMDMIFSKDSDFIKRIREEREGLGIDKILFIEPNEQFITGFTKKITRISSCDELSIVNNHVYPDGITSYDDAYWYVHFTEPSMAELYKTDVSLDFSKMYVNEENPIAFIAYADGSAEVPNTLNKLSSRSLKSMKKGFQTDSLKEIFNLKTEIYETGTGVKKIGIDFDNVIIYDMDGNLKTKDDQLAISGESGLDNIKTEGGLEWHPTLMDPFPQQMKYVLNFDQINKLSTKVGMSFDSKDFVKNANKALAFTNETKSILGVIDIAGIELTNKIYLGTIGLNIFTGAVEYGTLGNISKLDKSIVIPVNFFIEMDSSGQIDFMVEVGYTSCNTLGFNIQKEGFQGSFGSVEENRSSTIHQSVNNYAMDVYNDSTNTTWKGKPEAYIKGTLDGKLNARIGAGIDSGIMILGIMPISAGISISSSLDSTGKFEGNISSISEPEVEINGKVDLKGTLDAFYDARLVISNYEVFSNHGRITLWTIFDKHFEAYKGMKGTVYVNDEEKEPLSDVKVTFTNKTTGKIYEAISDEKGMYENSSVVPGIYEMSAYKDGYVCYISEVTVDPVNMVHRDVYLDPLTNSDATGQVFAHVEGNTQYPTKEVADAVVNVYKEGKLVKTVQANNEGYYSVGDLPYGTYEIEGVKSGYKPIRTEFVYIDDASYPVFVEKLPDITINTNETYRFTGIGEHPEIFVLGDHAQVNAADYSDNLRAAELNRTISNNPIPIYKDKYYDMTVLNGTVYVYLTESGSKEEIKGKKIDHSAVERYTLTSGQQMKITAVSSIGVWGYRPVAYKSIDASAVMTSNYTSVVPSEKAINPGDEGSTNIWGLSDTSTVMYHVNSGTLEIGIRYDDLSVMHIN